MLSWYDIHPLWKGGGLIEIAKHLLLEVILTTVDVILDLMTFLEFLEKGNVKWAYTNLSFIFLPFVLRVTTCTFEQLKNTYPLTYKVKTVLCTSIQYLPVIQTFFSIKRFFLLKDQTVHTSDPTKLIEAYKESTRLKVYEAFSEAAPSQILNLCIFLVTGSVTYTQIFSMSTSFLSLSLTGSAVFYLYRGKLEEDAHPSVELLSLSIIPMLLNTAASMIFWGVLAAHANILILPCTCLVFLVTYITLKIDDYFFDSKIDSNYRTIEIALINTWQPVAVGRQKSTLILSAIASYGSRLILILLLWIFGAYRANNLLKLNLVWSPPLLTCLSNESYSILQFKLTSPCYSLQDCFCGTSCGIETKEKIRYART